MSPHLSRRLAVLILTAGAAGLMPAADRTPLPWEKNRLRLGQVLYRDNCVVCHDIDRAETQKIGPSFYRLFKQPAMPLTTSVKPSRELIKAKVKGGGILMPSFQKWLSDSDIDTLIDYMASK
jgi:mono/diheme cytochrome c family protein